MKIKFKRYIGVLTLSLLILSCGGGGDDGPPPPPPNEAPPTVTVDQVNFPTPNLLCIDNNIAFDWNDVVDPDGDSVSYRIKIATDRDFNEVNIIESRETTNSEINITLPLATAFYWNITTIDSEGAESDPSETLAFFTMGEGQVNHAPFTAALVGPEDEGNIDVSATLVLTWDGADTDVGDTLIYDVFFGTDPNPPALANGMGISEETINVDASLPATTYYWRVNTTDNSGARSIGRVWQFTTN